MNVEIKNAVCLDGRPVQVISGAIHYFRVVPGYWRDRLEKLKAMGCNAVETYIPWNLHEPEKGRFCFGGGLDVERFIQLAQDLGLYVILRPSPYICAEWEFGGLPAWLLREDGMRLRTSDPAFLRHVEDYYRALLPRLVPWQADRGGPVILMQVENEYGSYGGDKAYLRFLRDVMAREGVSVPLVTSDGPVREALERGTVEGAAATVNFGSKAAEQFGYLDEFCKDRLPMCMEFWIGWFDHWGGGHIVREPGEAAEELDKLLALGSVNLYMFHGGTSFGFMNGANYSDHLLPDVSSYDYDAPLSEDGQITEKYRRFQAVIAKYRPIPEVPFTTPIRRKAYGRLAVSAKAGLFENLDKLSSPIPSPTPRSMERLGQSYGYILYRSTLATTGPMERIRLWKANDRAQVFLNGRPAATLFDRELLEEKPIGLPFAPGAKLDILMENMGRVNFGPMLEDQRKGIDLGVTVNGRWQHQWAQYPLPLEDVGAVDFSREYRPGLPAFYRFVFHAEELGDTFLDFAGWGKGCAFVNGTNIGRFWDAGPQKRLYIPAPLLREGENEIVLFETEGRAAEHITLTDWPALG